MNNIKSLSELDKKSLETARKEYAEFCRIFNGKPFNEVDLLVGKYDLSYGAERPYYGNGFADINYKSILATIIETEDGKSRISENVEIYDKNGFISYIGKI